MNGYLDIHSHILPGVDDGSIDMDMTLKMIGQAYDEGVRYMVATPHYYPGHRNAGKEHIITVFNEVRKEAAKQFSDMTIMLGNEIYFKDEAVELLKKKEIFTLNDSRYILVEFNVRMEYGKICQAIKKLTLNGYYPIIAHAERYACLYKRADLVEELIRAGAYIQINAESFLGGIFDGYRKYCIGLMAQEKVHFLGSDAHNTDIRKPVMEQAIKVLRKRIDSRILKKVMETNPEHYMKNVFI